MRLYVGDTNSNPVNLSIDAKHWCVEAGSGHSPRFPVGSHILLDSGAFPDVRRGRVSFADALERQLAMEARSGWRAEALVSYDLLIDEVLDPNGRQRKERWDEAPGWGAVETTVAAAEYLADRREQLSPRRLCLSCQGVTPNQYEECAKRVLGVARPGDWFRVRRMVHPRAATLADARVLRNCAADNPFGRTVWSSTRASIWRRVVARRPGVCRALLRPWDSAILRYDSVLFGTNPWVRIRPSGRKVTPCLDGQRLQPGIGETQHRRGDRILRAHPRTESAAFSRVVNGRRCAL